MMMVKLALTWFGSWGSSWWYYYEVVTRFSFQTQSPWSLFYYFL